MGSSGGGSFSDYPRGNRNQGGSDPAGDGGGRENPDPCASPITNIQLEEVGTGEYFNRHNRVPDPGAIVTLRPNLLGGRLAVETEGLVLGLLPTAHNYLRGCMERGFRYSGAVTSSSMRPIPRVRIDLSPTP
jgi:hypothetical protein